MLLFFVVVFVVFLLIVRCAFKTRLPTNSNYSFIKFILKFSLLSYFGPYRFAWFFQKLVFFNNARDNFKKKKNHTSGTLHFTHS